MPATRERALHAAVELLGTEGVRALTHARVDARAALPPGSTSNWFRTRRALLVGVVDWMAELERADLGPAGAPLQPSPEALIEGMCAVIELQTGPFAVRTRARYALFLELASDPELERRCAGNASSSSDGPRNSSQQPESPTPDPPLAPSWHSATA